MRNQTLSKEQDSQLYVVEASAGSGKTYCLAKRYIKLLFSLPLSRIPSPASNILAITFMNKAAVEMKERILELLKRLALDRFEDKLQEEDLFSYLDMDKKSARLKAYAAMQEIIQNYNYFQVQTIDSFINAILVGCAFKINLSANFAIKEDYQEYLVYGLDTFIDRALEDKNIYKLCLDFMYHYLMVENKTGWFAKQDILEIVRKLFIDHNRYGGVFRKYPVRPGDMMLKKRAIVKIIQELKKALPQEGVHKKFMSALDAFFLEKPEDFDINSLRSSYWGKEELPLNKEALVEDVVFKKWQSLNRKLEELARIEAYSFFNPYIDIFERVFQNFKTLAKKEDILFLEELNREARTLFDSQNISVPEIYYRLASRLRHYLIDEFQDTSILQWKNIYLMVEDALSTGGSLFYVGDKKQAIYRFRGGEVSLFEDIRRQFPQFKLEHQLLNRNYRSQKEIVDFNNIIFSQGNLLRFISEINFNSKDKNNSGSGESAIFEADDIKVCLELFRDAQQVSLGKHKNGYVRVERLETSDTQENDTLVRERILGLINELLPRGFGLKDIAILVRANADVEAITSWLIEENIPVESEKTLNIKENSYIKELISFLKFLHSPIDELSFASFILGEIFTRAAGISGDKIEEFIFLRNVERDKTARVYLYRDFQEKFPLAWENFIAAFFKHVGFLPLYEMLVDIFAKFKVLENFKDEQGFLMAFLELVKKKEDEYSGLGSFLDFFERARREELYVKMPRTDAVKIMTIHKAKGLEFPVVIIPYLEMNVRPGYRPEGFGSSYLLELDQRDNYVRLFSLKTMYRRFSKEIDRKYRQEYRKSFIDELNNIYVAFTRAKDELYIFQAGMNNKINLAGFLIPENITELGSRLIPEQMSRKDDDLINLEPPCYGDWIDTLKDEFVKEREIENRNRLLAGEVMHYALSFIGNLSRADKQEVLKNALAKTKARFPNHDGFTELEDIIKKLINARQLRHLFFADTGRVYTEKEIVDCLGHTRRIDRLVVLENEVLVIDFKTALEETAAQQEQIGMYLGLVKRIYPRLKVRGFLVYVDTFVSKEVN
jgi:ATP-dependent exoDNAse (exonuclease V) beta subunit